MDKKIKEIGIAVGVFMAVLIVLCFAASIMILNSKTNNNTEYEQALDKLAGRDETTSSVDDALTTEQSTESEATQGTKAGEAGATDTLDESSQGTDAGEAGLTDTTVESLQTGTASESVQTVAGETSLEDNPIDSTGKKHVIAINPDHQKKADTGKEPNGPNAAESKIKMSWGAEGVVTNVPEYRLTLAIGLKLKAELENRGYTVYMIRETEDVSISEAERAQLANEHAEIVIHIHGNAEERPEVSGIMAFYPSEKNRFVGKLSAECKKLGASVLNGLTASTGAKNWGTIALDNLTELNWTTIPATHVEVGYLSNAEEDKLLQTDSYRDLIAKGIADGIDLYYSNN